MGIASQVFEILLHLFSFKFLMVHGLLYNISSSQFCYSYIIIFSCLLFLHHFNLLTDFNKLLCTMSICSCLSFLPYCFIIIAQLLISLPLACTFRVFSSPQTVPLFANSPHKVSVVSFSYYSYNLLLLVSPF